MRNQAYKLWIAEKEGPIPDFAIERRIEIKSIEDIWEAVAKARKSLFLYLGYYELGELYGCDTKEVKFFSFMELEKYFIPINLFKMVIDKELTLEELFKELVPNYDLKSTTDEEAAWVLLLDDWKSLLKVGNLQNLDEISDELFDETMTDVVELWFIKKKQ